MSLAYDLLSALVVRLSSVPEAGANLHLGRAWLDPADPLPCLTLHDQGGRVTATRGDGTATVSNEVVIEGHAHEADPADHLATGHALIAAIKTALFASGRRVTLASGQGIDLAFSAHQVLPREPGSNLVTVQVKVDYSYVEDLTNP